MFYNYFVMNTNFLECLCNVDIVICVKMLRVDKDVNKEDTTLHFRGGTRLILRESDFDGALKKIGSGGFACATRGGVAMHCWPLLLPTSGLFGRFFLLFTASIRSRPPGPPGVLMY